MGRYDEHFELQTGRGRPCWGVEKSGALASLQTAALREGRGQVQKSERSRAASEGCRHIGIRGVTE